MIGVGVAGCGYWGSKVLRNLEATPGLRAAAVCDPKPGRRSYVEERHPGIAIEEDFGSLLDRDDVEAIWLATPARTHASMARDALSRRRHVLVEKPMAASAAEAAALVDLADSLGMALHTGHTYLHSPAVASLRRLIDDNAHGRTCYITSERINPGPPASEVSVLWDLAVHDVAIILHLTGRNPVAVAARGGQWRRADVAEAATVTLELEGGIAAHVHVSWMSALKTRLTRVFGSEATLVYDDLADPPVRWIGSAFDNRPGAADSAAVCLAYGPGETRDVRPQGAEPLATECAAFRDAILSGKPAPNEGRKALPVVEVLEAAELSLASGGARVELPGGRGAVIGASR